METGHHSFLVVPSTRSGNRHKMEHGRFPLNTRQHFHAVQVMEHWHGLPREAMQPPILEVFESHLDVVLGRVALGAPAEQGLDQRASRGPLQFRPFGDSEI